MQSKRVHIQCPDSKIHGGQHGAHLGPVGPRWAHVGPMKLVIGVGILYVFDMSLLWFDVVFQGPPGPAGPLGPPGEDGDKVKPTNITHTSESQMRISVMIKPPGMVDFFTTRFHSRRECRERFPRHRLKRKPLVNDPGMHHGTCVTHVPSCMSGSLTCGGVKNVPGIPGACAAHNFTNLARGPWWS